ncbi:MAG: hypothetical protein F6K40_05495 [Okeania sp. SIO3I5]|uniref:hypothetical protein n=1 Tax=Okeania sp. SIO3I5 TaxID=2607805 RepID=UPI0013BB9A01|nr:hypothetical protein [Okeania sp. SIO3I5]NEQ35768.1 hypothetical protein [Okeania sp. SIO3I5]
MLYTTTLTAVPNAMNDAASVAIIGVIYGAITGATLLWLLRQPGNSAINNKN